jgi:hypothetical protein
MRGKEMGAQRSRETGISLPDVKGRVAWWKACKAPVYTRLNTQRDWWGPARNERKLICVLVNWEHETKGKRLIYGSGSQRGDPPPPWRNIVLQFF